MYTVLVAYSLDMVRSPDTVRVLLRNNLLMRCTVFCDRKQMTFSEDVRDALWRFYDRFQEQFEEEPVFQGIANTVF